MVGVEEGQAAEVVGGVTRQDCEPGVQSIESLEVEHTVVFGEHFGAFGDAAIQTRCVVSVVVEDHGE